MLGRKPGETACPACAFTASPAPRAFRALWMAEELGLDYAHLPIEIGDAGARAPEFLSLNPNGRLPAIADDGFVLFEQGQGRQ